MNIKKEKISQNKLLHKKAEKSACEHEQDLENLNPEEIKRLVHELKVYQTELEMQNDELTRLYHELEIAKEHYLDLYNNAPVGYILLNSDNSIIQINLTALNLFQVKKKDIIDQKIQKYIYTKDQDIFYLFQKNITSAKEKYDCELRLSKSDGKKFWAYMQVTLEQKNTKHPLYKIIIEDITKRKTLEDELRKKEELMIAQSRHAAMGEMISMIAHQWRQPLSNISMAANNIMVDIDLDTADKDTFFKHAKDIHLQTEELSKTIDDFKNFFKPTKVVENVLPKDIINETLKVIGKSLENHEITIITQFNSDKQIDTYSRELMQVFINIIKNAKEKLIEKNITDKQIKIEIEHDQNGSIIRVCDNGGGIAENIIDKIFDPYFSTKDEKSGTGLGLYMSKTIIEKHLNGKLDAYNENGGACFKIKLPFKIKK